METTNFPASYELLPAKQLLFSKDYSRFEKDPSNRDVTLKCRQRSLRDIKEKVTEYGFIYGIPIAVKQKPDGKLVIWDGQGRFTVAESLGLEIPFIIVEDLNIPIHELQVNSSWNAMCHVDTHANKGNKDYQFLRDWSKEKGIQVVIASKIISGDMSHQDIIKKGEFKVNPELVSYADRVAKILSRIKNTIKQSKNHNFIFALVNCVKNKDFNDEVFISQIQRNALKFHICPSISTTIEMISKIYNKGGTKPKFVYNEKKKSKIEQEEVKDTFSNRPFLIEEKIKEEEVSA